MATTVITATSERRPGATAADHALGQAELLAAQRLNDLHDAIVDVALPPRRSVAAIFHRDSARPPAGSRRSPAGERVPAGQIVAERDQCAG